MCRSDNRFKLPAGHFSTNDLVLAFPPPPSRVYNPFYRLSSPKPSSHKDYDHFGRMRRWLIQTYSNVTWIFKDYDDFYPRDQTPSGHDEDDTPRLRVFVNDVYGLYEVAHWEDAEEQNVTSQKLLDLLEAIGPVDTDLSGVSRQDCFEKGPKPSEKETTPATPSVFLRRNATLCSSIVTALVAAITTGPFHSVKLNFNPTLHRG
ncbi:hypothetical protein DV738_g442, partial [Chaetothyriales sp. CBS 135597]